MIYSDRDIKDALAAGDLVIDPARYDCYHFPESLPTIYVRIKIHKIIGFSGLCRLRNS